MTNNNGETIDGIGRFIMHHRQQRQQQPTASSSSSSSSASASSPIFPFWCGNCIIYCDPSNNNSSRYRSIVNDDDSNNNADDDSSSTDVNDPIPSLHTTGTTTLHRNHHRNHTNTTRINKILHGLAMDVYGRATIGMSSIYLGPALLSMANHTLELLNNSTNSNNNNNNNNNVITTIYGFRPSSLLTNIAAISGLLGCMALPLFGSILDYTSYRKRVGILSAIGLCLLKGIEYMCITYVYPYYNTIWFFIAWLQVLASILFYVHLMAAYAYLSELTSSCSSSSASTTASTNSTPTTSTAQQQSYYNSALFVVMYTSTLIYMIEVIVGTQLFGTSDIRNDVDNSNNSNSNDIDIQTASIALFITFITCSVCFTYSWIYYFPTVSAKKVLPSHTNIYTAGFYSIYTTISKLYHHRRRHRHHSYNTITTAAATETVVVAAADEMDRSSNANNNHTDWVHSNHNDIPDFHTSTTKSSSLLFESTPNHASYPMNDHTTNHRTNDNNANTSNRTSATTTSSSSTTTTTNHHISTESQIQQQQQQQQQQQYGAMYYLLCSISLSEASANAIIVISTTYMKEVLQLNASNSYVYMYLFGQDIPLCSLTYIIFYFHYFKVGIIFLIVLLSGIPGSQLGRYVTMKCCINNPIRSLMLCNGIFGASTILAAMVLRTPNDASKCYLFGGLWGMCLGWLQPLNTSCYVPLLPPNQEAEMMGLYLFACQILSWLPPTIFTIMNELLVPMYYGLGVLSMYFSISIFCLYSIGDYQSAVNSKTEVHNNRNDDMDDDGPTNKNRNDIAFEMTSQVPKPFSSTAEADAYYPSSPLRHEQSQTNQIV